MMLPKVHESANDFFDNPLFILNKKYLSILGRWPYQNKMRRTSLVFLAFIGTITVVIPEVIYFIKVIKDVYKMIDCLPALIFTYAAFVMIVNSIQNFHIMKQLLDEIYAHWMELQDKKEYSIFQEYAEEGRLLILAYSACIIGTVIFFSIVPLIPKIFDIISPLNETRPATNILEVEYLVDPDKYYMPIYFHGLQAAFFVIFTVLTIDTYFVMIVQHACSMFIVLGYRINKIAGGSTYKFHHLSKFEQDRLVSDEIITCMKYHKDCMRFAELIEESFTISWIMQIFANMVVISITSVQTITRTSKPEETLKFGMNTISIISRLFYISWPGQKIYDHSVQVHEFVSNIRWYNFPPKSKKLLLLMLLRSSKACNITAGKMIPMNFQTYCKLMQTSMSYFTMILSTQ